MRPRLIMGSSEYSIPFIVVDLKDKDNVSSVISTVNNFATRRTDQLEHVFIWNSAGIDLAKILETDSRFASVQFVVSLTTFLNSGKEIYKIIDLVTLDRILILDGSVVLGPDEIDVFMEKFHEYDPALLCSKGVRMFPHHPFSDPEEFWRHKRYIQCYDCNNHTDREVHLFILEGGCCLIRKDLLSKALALRLDSEVAQKWKQIGDFHLSAIIANQLRASIWVVRMNLLGAKTDAWEISPDTFEELSQFYRSLTDINWPKGLFSPMEQVVQRKRSHKRTIWEQGFHGLNMSAEPLDLDFSSARGYGASVVRFGAVNDAKDLSFLVNDINGGSSVTDKVHLQRMLPRLRSAVKKAGDCGLKVILTLCDLPCRRFRDTKDFRVWESAECRQRIAGLWALIAAGVRDMCDTVIGYDIINEPFTSQDTERSFDSTMSESCLTELHDLYVKALKAIRAVDEETMVIVESTFWASPLTVPLLMPLDDPFVSYSFHFYAPCIYTFRHHNDGRYIYPGPVPRWRNDKWPDEWPVWDAEKIKSVVQPVVKWQQEHGIPSSRIFVGEFGVCREVPGAQRYLADVMKIWNDNGWNWCVFSFRDNEWDAMDYELGEDRANQLDRTLTDMMKQIADNLF